MAIIKSIGVGKARGSVGEFTYTTIEGRTIARSKPAFVSNPNTPLQQAQRSRMRNIVFLWTMIGQRFGKLWTKRAKYNSPYNAFVSANIQNEAAFNVDIEDNSYSLFQGLILGQGSYTQKDIRLDHTVGGLGAKVSNLSALESTIKVGDKFGLIQLDDNGAFVSEDIIVLTEENVQTLRSGEGVFIGDEHANGQVFLPYWLSADGTRSTSVVV